MQRKNLRSFCQFVMFLSAVPVLGASLAFAASPAQTSTAVSTASGASLSSSSRLSAWETRERNRKQREAELLNSNLTGDSLTRVAGELKQIYHDRKADPRPENDERTNVNPEPKAVKSVPEIRTATSGPNTLSAWEKRERDRKQRRAELLSSNPSGDALTRATEELQRIYRDQKADPRPGGARTAGLSADQEKAAEYGIQGVTTALENFETSLEKDIELAPRQLSGNRLKVYLDGAEDTKSVMRGIRNFISAAEYGKLAAEWFKAENDDEKRGALIEGEMKLLTDIAQAGFKELAPKLFGPRVAAVLLGPVAWTASIGLDVLTPTPTGRSYQEIIRDNRSKLAEKQEALTLGWRIYEKNNQSWDSDMKRELWDLTGVVHREANSGPMR